MSDDDEIVESFSPAGNVLQPFNSVSLSPEEVLTKTKALEVKSPNWGRLFTPGRLPHVLLAEVPAL